MGTRRGCAACIIGWVGVAACGQASTVDRYALCAPTDTCRSLTICEAPAQGTTSGDDTPWTFTKM
jgi:hypothetical protein